jgi:hypothetical protein
MPISNARIGALLQNKKLEKEYTLAMQEMQESQRTLIYSMALA